MFQTTNQDMYVQYCTIMNPGIQDTSSSSLLEELGSPAGLNQWQAAGALKYGRRIECESPPSPICSMVLVYLPT